MSRLLRRLRRADRRLLPLAVLVVGELELLLQAGSDPDYPLMVLLAGAAYSMLFWRHSHPLLAGAAMIGLWVLANLALTSVYDIQAPLLAVLMMSYSMGANTGGWAAPASLLVIAVGMTGVTATFDEQVFTDYVFPTAFGAVAWLAGRGITTRTRLTEELHEAAVRAQEAHEQEIARATGEERRRIAREMHDVVAHSVSVMVVQAGGARRILEHDPARAVEAAARIEDVGRAAMAEMRRLLGVMHHGDDHRAPQPTLRELDALVERSRAAGLPVALTVEGEPRTLPAGMDLTAYRVVQEALTNALKHAGAAPTEVTIRWEPTELELEIIDRGAIPNGHNPGGHGLVGMEERVRLYDGRLRAGPRSGGGFEVVARLPL